MVWLLLACSPADVRVVGVVDLGPLETTEVVKARDGGYSVAFGGVSAWLYGDTVLALGGEDGSSWRDNSWSWTADLDARDGITGFTEPVDGLGAPEELFPETAEEAAYNDAHRDVDADEDGVSDCAEPCGGREILWPMDAVPADGGALVFYVKIHGEPGEWNFSTRGVGVADWASIEVAPTRPEPGVIDGEPTLLFSADEPSFGTAATVAPDGLLYAWGYRDDGGAKQMRLGRVDPVAVQDRGAWRFWDGADWSAELDAAEPVFTGASQMKVSWDPALATWLAVYMDEPWDALVARTAPAPEGPWSAPIHLTDTLEPPDGGWGYCGIDHPEYAHDGVHYVSYFRGLGDWQGEIRLVQVTFEAR